jgi:hypothetical protein
MVRRTYGAKARVNDKAADESACKPGSPVREALTNPFVVIMPLTSKNVVSGSHRCRP